MPWLVTHAGEALNIEHVQRLYADKTKVRAVIAGFPVNVAVDLATDVAQRILRDHHRRGGPGCVSRGRGRGGSSPDQPALSCPSARRDPSRAVSRPCDEQNRVAGTGSRAPDGLSACWWRTWAGTSSTSRRRVLAPRFTQWQRPGGELGDHFRWWSLEYSGSDRFSRSRPAHPFNTVIRSGPPEEPLSRG